jgi:hypothetical protein
MLLIAGVSEIRHFDSLKCHGIHTTFYGDQFRHLNNIKVTSSTILEASVLVLLKVGIYGIRL